MPDPKPTSFDTYFYLRKRKNDGHYHRFGCVALRDYGVRSSPKKLVDDGLMIMSYSICNNKDNFIPKKARTIALGRLNSDHFYKVLDTKNFMFDNKISIELLYSHIMSKLNDIIERHIGDFDNIDTSEFDKINVKHLTDALKDRQSNGNV